MHTHSYKLLWSKNKNQINFNAFEIIPDRHESQSFSNPRNKQITFRVDFYRLNQAAT